MTTVFTVPFGLIGAHTGVASLSVWMLLRGIGLGFSFMPAMTAAFATLERHELSHATPQLNVLNRVGGSIGGSASQRLTCAISRNWSSADDGA